MNITKKDEVFFLPLGGSGEIGMNLNLYAHQGKWLMVDLGVTFERELGMEVVMPDPSFILERKKDLVGIVLTHAHEDHIGAVPHLWEKLQCPLYATPFTATLVRAKLKEAGLLGKATVIDIPVSGSVDIDPFHIEFIRLTHSIPEPNALAITTEAGVVLHTGDWKLDPEPLVGNVTDEDRLTAVGDAGVLAMTCDSTNVFEKEHTGSEQDVRDGLDKIVKGLEGRVVIACFASNVARLETAAMVGLDTGRRVGLAGRSLLKMDQAARACGYLPDLPPFEDLQKLKSEDPAKVLYICTGSQGESRAALARIAAGKHPDVRLEEGDTVIFSSREIPGNEEEIRDLQKSLMNKGIHIVTARDDFTHVSGHPGQEDLKQMYSWVRPEILIPVHGEEHHMEEQARFGKECGIPKAIVPNNGTLIRLKKGEEPKIVERVPTGRWALDGKNIVPLDSSHFKERFIAMNEGVIAITAIVGSDAGLFAPPQITFLGIADEKAYKKIHTEITDAVEDTLLNMHHKSKSDNAAIQENIRQAVRRTLKRLRNKKPLTAVHVVRLKGKPAKKR